LILFGITREIFYQTPENLYIHKPNFEFNNKKRIWSAVKTLWFLRIQIKDIQPDTILSFGELWNNFVLLATLGLKYPVYVSDRCQPNKSLGKVHSFLRKRLYPKAAGVICQTQIAKEIYQSIFNHENFVVIGNPIHTIQNHEEIKKENIILSIGRLIKTKHHDELIQIFSEIVSREWKLIIVGDDALKQRNKEKLEILVRNLGLQDRVKLVGKHLDVDSFYNKAKIFAFTSSSEGFPNVIGEAMSAGLPVISYNCVAGPSDLIHHEKSGYLIKQHDKKGFKEALDNLIKNEDLRNKFGQEAKLRIQEFSINNIGKKFEKTILIESSSN
jgi:glycosyltransferase involved in cell wall biosynthesis